MGKKRKRSKHSASDAGAVIGKELRRTAAPILQWASHPVIADALAAALIAAAAALTDNEGPKGIAKAAGLGAGAAAVKSARGSGRVGLAFAVAASEVAIRLFLSCTERQGSEHSADRRAARRA